MVSSWLQQRLPKVEERPSAKSRDSTTSVPTTAKTRDSLWFLMSSLCTGSRNQRVAFALEPVAFRTLHKSSVSATTLCMCEPTALAYADGYTSNTLGLRLARLYSDGLVGFGPDFLVAFFFAITSYASSP